jgi:tripartite-type tricarboxylate transporter receptor subunit TctC
MIAFRFARLSSLLGAIALLIGSVPANADAVSDFYKGKTVDLFVGAGAGSGFDLIARPLAKYLTRHIPGNPVIVVRNMPGAAGIIMANYLINRAPSDGTAMGLSPSNVAFEPRMKLMSSDGSKANYDPRSFQWIGSPLREPQVSWVWHTSGVKTWQDLKTKKVHFGATSVGGDNFIFPALTNRLLGLRSEIITGYQSSRDIFLAVERGELDANSTAYSTLVSTKSAWVRDGKARIVMQYGLERLPAIKDVPTLIELVQDPDLKPMLHLIFLKFEMHAPLYAPPKIPADRRDALRNAFDLAAADPDFIAETNRMGVEISPVGGNAIAEIVDEIMATPQAVVDRARSELLAAGSK